MLGEGDEGDEGDKEKKNPYNFIPAANVWLYDQRLLGNLLSFVAAQANKEAGTVVMTTWMDQMSTMRAYWDSYLADLVKEHGSEENVPARLKQFTTFSTWFNKEIDDSQLVQTLRVVASQATRVSRDAFDYKADKFQCSEVSYSFDFIP